MLAMAMDILPPFTPDCIWAMDRESHVAGTLTTIGVKLRIIVITDWLG